MNFTGKTIVVTGAGSGIGRALCRELVARGAVVAACDVDHGSAAETVASLDGDNTSHAFRLDVADEASWAELVGTIVDKLPPVDGLINNAGVLGRWVPLEDLRTDELRWVFDVDLWGAVYGTRAFLPHLRQRPEAVLVNVASLAGLLASVGNPAYFSAKFAVNGFSASMRSYLWNSTVRVATVFPGVVRTNLGASDRSYNDDERAAAIARYNAQPGLTPERAARKIVRSLERGRTRILVGNDAWLMDKVVRVAPTVLDRFAHRYIVKMANRQVAAGQTTFT